MHDGVCRTRTTWRCDQGRQQTPALRHRYGAAGWERRGEGAVWPGTFSLYSPGAVCNTKLGSVVWAKIRITFRPMPEACFSAVRTSCRPFLLPAPQRRSQRSICSAAHNRPPGLHSLGRHTAWGAIQTHVPSAEVARGSVAVGTAKYATRHCRLINVRPQECTVTGSGWRSFRHLGFYVRARRRARWKPDGAR